jgi:hypothetical protein
MVRGQHPIVIPQDSEPEPDLAIVQIVTMIILALIPVLLMCCCSLKLRILP